jgi:hypothetical protein
MILVTENIQTFLPPMSPKTRQKIGRAKPRAKTMTSQSPSLRDSKRMKYEHPASDF